MKKTRLFVLGISSLLLLAGCGDVVSSSISETSSETSSSSSGNTSSSQTSESSASESSTSSEEPSSSESSSTSESSSSEAVKTYDIYVTCDDGATVSEVASKAEGGEEVHFTLSILDGFALSSLKIVSGTNEISYTVGFDGDYSFTMPKKGVEIKVVTSRKSYEVATTDVAGFISSIKQKKVGSDNYVELESVTETDTDDEGEEVVTSSYKAAQYGATVLVELNEKVNGYSISGITLNEKTIDLKDGETSFSFVMGHETASIKVSYDYSPIPVSTINSEHITLSLFADDKVTAVTNSYTPYKDLYIKATSSSEDYAVKTLSYTYTDNNQETKTVDILSSLEDGFYHFRTPLYESGVKITVTEYDLHAYKDYAFVGEFAQVDFSYAGSSDITSFTANTKMKISESGDIVYTRSSSIEYTDYSVSSITGDKEEGTASLSKAGSYAVPTIEYSGNVLVYDAYFKSSASKTNDLAVAYKKEDSNATYTTKATQFKLGSVTYALASFYKDGTIAESVLVERGGSSLVIHYGVEVTMLEGEYVSDAKAIFNVKEDETTLLKVGYNGNGGAANRVSLGDEYGTFTTADEKTLYLNGAGSATYDGNEYSYALADDGATITLTSNSKTIIGTLDLDNKTFTVTSEEENVGYPWYGKTYSGTSQYSAYDDDVGTTWTVVFHSGEDKMDASAKFNPSFYNDNGKDTEYTVTDGMTVTTKLYTAAHKTGFTITMKYDSAKDTFTVNGGVNGDYFSNSVFKLVA